MPLEALSVLDKRVANFVTHAAIHRPGTKHYRTKQHAEQGNKLTLDHCTVSHWGLTIKSYEPCKPGKSADTRLSQLERQTTQFHYLESQKYEL